MNKFNKGKTIGIITASLAAISLVGVGFSTWIINTTNKAEVSDISVTVADTKDISVVISNAQLDKSDNTVKFDADETKMNSATGHLLSCASGDSEDLSFTLTYDVTVGTDAKKWQIMAAIDDGNTTGGAGEKFNTAVNTRKYICLPTTLGITTGVKCLDQASTTDSNSGLTVNEKTGSSTTSTMTYSVSQKFTFTWGLAFANKNPVEVISTDKIYTQTASDGSATTDATLELLTANTRAMKNLGLEKFKVILSVGTVSQS